MGGDTKRALIGFVFSNLEMRGATLCYSLQEPFCGLQNLTGYKEWLSALDTARTRHHQAVVQLYQRLPGTLAAALV
jgi:hypothetical protein